MTWYCANCGAVGELSRHGRCQSCNSNAVDIASRDAERINPTQASIEALEELYRKS